MQFPTSRQLYCEYTHFSSISIIFVAMKTFLKILTLFIAVGAIGGAVMMWMDPTGVPETAAAYYCIKKSR